MIGKEDRIILDYNEHNATLNAKKEIDGMLGGIRDKDHPEKILRVDVFEEGVNVTLMRPKDLFEKK